ncbi:site-specific integrase [Clostridia bacterium]|nr:site-specific integrase [Clostridia bacterium]
MKFEEIAKEWLCRKSVGVTYTHIKDLEYRINHLVSALGQKEIEKIKWVDVENLLISRAIKNPNTKKPASKKLVTNLKNTAYSIFEYAIDLELIQINPIRGKKIPKCAPRKKRRALTPREQQLILKTNHRLKAVAVIMMLLGLRTGEIIPLVWNDIDLVELKIFVNKSVTKISANKYEIKTGTKNGKERILPIPVDVAIFLEKEKNKAEFPFITCQLNGKLHTPSSWKSAWRSFYNQLNFTGYDGKESIYTPKGIPKIVDNITPHMLRHTFETLLYTSGVDVLTASELLGHADTDTTLEIYTHLQEITILKSIDKYDQFLTSNIYNSNLPTNQ